MKKFNRDVHAEEVWNEGYTALIRGASRKDNPYKGTALEHHWEFGWWASLQDKNEPNLED